MESKLIEITVRIAELDKFPLICRQSFGMADFLLHSGCMDDFIIQEFEHMGKKLIAHLKSTRNK